MPVLAALAELRQDDIVDDSIIEIVAGDTDAAMAERLRTQRITGNLEANDRIVRRATTKIGDEHRCRSLQIAGEEKGGGHRLVNMEDFKKPKRRNAAS